MIHTCNLARCKHGDINAPCKYGFPKPCNDNTTYDPNSGKIIYQRNADDAYIVEYSPVLLLN